MTSRVTVAIVTWGSAADLPDCLAAVAAQTHRPLDLVIVDCVSDDGSAEVAATAACPGVERRVEALAENRGFAGGMNRALAMTDAPFVLTLNADARPSPDYVERLLARLEAPSPWRFAAATGRLVRFPPGTAELQLGSAPLRPGGAELQLGSAPLRPGGAERQLGSAPLRPGGAERQLGSAPLRPGGAELQLGSRLDACGMVLTRAWRHLDRGSGELDRGQLATAERVFGATGAATLWRREALDDVALDVDALDVDALDVAALDVGSGRGEVFDEAFHSYREDAELCFRLQERGWEVVYEPAARAEHRRRVVPAGRRRLPAAINRQSLENRYRLRAAHQTGPNLVRTFVPTLFRDLQALVYVLLAERSSLAAYRTLWRERRELAARRRTVQARRTAPPEAVERWFRHASLPL